MLKGIGLAIGLFACFLFWKSGWADRLVDLIKPAEKSVATLISETVARASDRDIKCLRLILYVEGRTKIADHTLIARAAINYVQQHNGATFCELVRTGRLTLADSQIGMSRQEKVIWLNTKGLGSKSETQAWEHALVIADRALKGDFSPYNEVSTPKLRCISRMNRKAGSYAKILALLGTRRKLIKQFGNPVLTGPNGAEFFCP